METTVVPEKRKWRAPLQDLRWFIFFYYITCCAVWGALSHNNAIIRVLEKRFGLSGFQSGFILSVNDIVNMVLVLFVGYLGRTWSKPHFLGVLCFLGSFGSALFALPYPLYPSVATNTTSNTPLLCIPGLDRPNATECFEETEAAANSQSAYGIFLVSSAILGLGNCGLGVLSISYIDENAPRNLAALYIGIASSANTIGPLVGFGMAYLTLRLPENLKDSIYEEDDELFIGCWWLAFLIWAAVMIIGSVGMLFCPKHLPYYYEQKEKAKLKQKMAGKIAADKNRKKTFKENAAETWSNIKSVFTNVPYALLVFSTLAAYYIVPGIFAQIPKYLVVQFKITQSLTSIYTGICSALVISIALVVIGVIIRKTNMGLRGSIFMFTLSIIGIVASLTGMIFWECDQPQLAGAVDVQTYDIPYYPECRVDANCECTGVQPMCSPVDDLSFISPCHAGCTGFNRTESGAIFTNCACVRGVYGNDSTLGKGYVQGALCPRPTCNDFIPYLFFVAMMSFCSAGARLGAVILQLRVIRKDMKSFAIGLTSFLHNGLAFVPGPIMFGAIIDSTCVLWQELECGQRGACIKYNMDDYRIYMHGISLGFQVVSLVLILPMYHTAKPLFNIEPTEDQQIELFSSKKSKVNDKQAIENGINSENNTFEYTNGGAQLDDESNGTRNEKDERTNL